MVRVLRINMKTKQFTFNELKGEALRLGGRALIGKIMFEEVNPICHPLGPQNKIIIANGLLVNSSFPCPGRLSVGGKSPLTGGIKESNVGGLAATRMSQLGIRGIVIEEAPQENELYILVISKDKVEFVKGTEFKGKGNYETVRKLMERWGPRIATLSIGPAGEQLLAASSVAASDMLGRPARHAGRGGMGAVLGSKKVKSLVLLRPDVLEQEPTRNLTEFNQVTREFNKILIPKKKGMTAFGTAGMVRVANEVGGLPTKNYRFGSFDQMPNISGEKLIENIESRKGRHSEACSPGCVIRCSNMYPDKTGNYITSGLEYETIALNGSNLLIGDLDIIAQIDRACDDIGLDTIEMGNAMAVAMEAGLLKWGDEKAVLTLLKEISEGTLKGKLLGSGAATVGRVLGIARVTECRGQGFPAYDPRTFKAMGMTFATSPMGADHTSGPAIAGRTGWDPAKNYGELTETKGKIELAREIQVLVSLCDSFGFCFFVGPDKWVIDYLLKAINAKFDWNFTFNDLIAYGKKILRTEHEFNKRAGVSQVNRLPDFIYQEALPPKNNRWDLSPEQLKDFQEFFST